MMDKNENKEMIEAVALLAKEKNIAILSSLHDLNQALQMGDKFFLLKDGVVKYAGGPEIITPETVRDIFGIDVQLVEVDGRTVVVNAPALAAS